MNIDHTPDIIHIGKYPYWRIRKELALTIDKDAMLKTTFPVKYLTLHWTAGSYTTLHNDYHFLVDLNYVYISKTINTRWHEHCYKANSNNLGIGVCGMFGATESDIGRYPIKQDQIETTAKLVSVLKKHFRLANFHDHKYFADLNGYSKYRWDCRYAYTKKDAENGLISVSEVGKTIYEIVDQKSNWYKSKY